MHYVAVLFESRLRVEFVNLTKYVKVQPENNLKDILPHPMYSVEISSQVRLFLKILLVL